MTFFGFKFFRNAQNYLNLEEHNSHFQSKLRKEVNKNFSCSIFLWAQDFIRNQRFEFFYTAQVTKLIWFKFSKTFSSLLGWIFNIISRNMNFCFHFAKNWRNLHFLKKNRKFHFNDQRKVFSPFLTTLSQFDIHIYMS